MKTWPEATKQVLRHLAAARFFLPVTLKQTDGLDTEAQYVEFMHHAEFELAMNCLEDLGDLNRGFAEEPLFWFELALAAQIMELTVAAAKFTARAADQSTV